MQQFDYARLLEPLLHPAAGYAHSILRNRQQAQDAVQQAALRGLEGLHSFDPTRSFREWWFSILHNCCIDLLRSDKSAYHVSLDNVDIAEAEQEPDTGAQLMAGIAALSINHQEILRLKYFADFSYKEIAATLGIPQGTVMSRLHLARLALATQLKEDTQ